jgi:uncharacterized membrane protein YkoI
MSRFTRVLFAAVAIAICLTPALLARERRIKRSELPPAVEKTVAEQSQGATILAFTTEGMGAKTVYEVEMKVNGLSKDVSMNADGSVAEVEEQVNMSDLPSNVKAGLANKAGKGKILKIESLTKQGKLVAYEAVIANGASKREIQVGPEGQVLAHEE